MNQGFATYAQKQSGIALHARSVALVHIYNLFSTPSVAWVQWSGVLHRPSTNAVQWRGSRSEDAGI